MDTFVRNSYLVKSSFSLDKHPEGNLIEVDFHGRVSIENKMRLIQEAIRHNAQQLAPGLEWASADKVEVKEIYLLHTETVPYE